MKSSQADACTRHRVARSITIPFFGEPVVCVCVVVVVVALALVAICTRRDTLRATRSARPHFHLAFFDPTDLKQP